MAQKHNIAAAGSLSPAVNESMMVNDVMLQYLGTITTARCSQHMQRRDNQSRRPALIAGPLPYVKVRNPRKS